MDNSSSERNGDPEGPDEPDESDPGPSPTDDVSPPALSLDVRRLTDLVSDHAVSLLDQDGRVVSWNEGVTELLGYSQGDVLGAHYRVFFPAETREIGRPEELLERARTTGRAEDEGWRLRSDDGRIWVREILVPIRDDGVGEFGGGEDSDHNGHDQTADLRGYARLLHDRTEEHEREQRLREEQAFTESVFSAQPDIVYAFDTEGNFLEWNDRVPEVTGYAESELAEMRPLEFVVPEHRDRIADAVQRILDEDDYVAVEADLLTKDGTRIPYEFNNARMTDADGSTLGLTGVGRDISERKARERELREEKALTESIFEAQPDVLYAYDTDGNLIHWNERFEQLTGYDGDELEGMSPLEFIAPADRDHIGDAIGRILSEGERVTAEGRVLTKDGTHIPYEFNSARITDDTGTVLGFTGVGRDISERKARERELERLERLNATIRTIDETMVAAETRNEIETAIVEAFAAEDAYRFAILGHGETAMTTERRPREPRAVAGIDATAAGSILESFCEPPTERPGRSPSEEGSVQCYHRLRESSVDDWRTDARSHDYGSVAAVPITASGRTFGLLVVAAEEPTAFAEREREVLQEFGGTIGHAINAMAIRRLLYLDTVVELEFESTDRQDVCIDLSAWTGSRLTFDHVLPVTDETFVYYVTITDAGPERVRSFVTDHPAVREVRRIDAVENGHHWELTIHGSTIISLLADYGARMRSQIITDGVSSTVVQLSPDVEVRDLVDAVTSAYPDTRLVSKHTVERSVETRGDFRRQVQDELTEKQRTALEAAYYGGYFEWPTRNSDASEIADQLGIARQTFHQHLRVAQEKLLTAYFEEGRQSETEQDG
ncbi:PAS domain S-box protein [Natronorubrum sp. JWXQ-INN-674]|uniref:PAS domain S-box protein n=1 Tax=Natronorubrum halalkaliphilum TaxID=2691917 RepID=A0A6B0VQH9_9EURY|nr:PAS domain S-box protein [Natronorubrum halalkaliphilum]MXV63758.1 PAS domain S-box protein [Natronorubrum halalkaliphilum]